MCNVAFCMKYRNFIRSLLIVVVCCISGTSVAEVFFEDDFESGTIDSSPSPQWSWTDAISPGNVTSNMNVRGGRRLLCYR